ncbi:MAG TPA: glycosyltransferase family A protein [Pyrinomonadaceae bacterium]|jgi:glycosyltransferase involved in cell wall biosynthesis
MAVILPVSAIVPTRERAVVFDRMLRSLAAQSAQPLEMIVVDASDGQETAKMCEGKIEGLATRIEYHRADEAGAATQRNQAIAHATQGAVLFLDDDIVFEPDCIARLWQALESDARMGGVNAMITNQRYFPPGQLSRTLFRVLDGRAQESYAGRCIGPAFNLLPEDREDLPEVVPVEWLNTTCTLYRREALPEPLFDSHFAGYSLMEDLALSLHVGRKWKLANARLAKIFHDSQPGAHKDNAAAMSRMELVNRHYVMTRVLGRQSFSDYLKLGLFETFGIVTSLTSIGAWRTLPAVLLGKLAAMGSVLTNRDSSRA